MALIEVTMTTFPIDAVRARFPALHVTDGGRPRLYFDAPGGTQMCDAAITAMTDHLARGTANAGGAFTTSRGVGALVEEAQRAAADLLNAQPHEIAFGPNMTSLTFAVKHDTRPESAMGFAPVLVGGSAIIRLAPQAPVSQSMTLIAESDVVADGQASNHPFGGYVGAFVFNTTLLALTVNIAAGLFGR